MERVRCGCIPVLLALPLSFTILFSATAHAMHSPGARLEECRAIIAANPDPDQMAGAWLEMGIILSFSPEHDHQEGIAAFQKIVSEHPRSRWADDALWYLGKAYLFSLQDVDKAISAYQEALDNYGGVSFERLPGMVEHTVRLLKGKPPDYLNASALRGEIEKLRKAWERTDALEARIQNEPDPQKSSKLHFALAEAHRSLANFPQAVEIYEEIVQQSPTQNEAAQARFEMGEVCFRDQVAFLDSLHYARLSDLLKGPAYEEAVNQYQEVLKNYPASEWYPQTVYRISECYFQLGEYIKAKDGCNKLIEKCPESLLAKKAMELSSKADSEYHSSQSIKEYAGAYSVAERFCQVWQNKDYGMMYEFLSQDSKTKVSKEEFIKRYEVYAARGSQLLIYKLFLPTVDESRTVTINVSMDFGNDFSPDVISGVNRFYMVREAGGWKIKQLKIPILPPSLDIVPNSHAGDQ